MLLSVGQLPRVTSPSVPKSTSLPSPKIGWGQHTLDGFAVDFELGFPRQAVDKHEVGAAQPGLDLKTDAAGPFFCVFDCARSMDTQAVFAGRPEIIDRRLG